MSLRDPKTMVAKYKGHIHGHLLVSIQGLQLLSCCDGTVEDLEQRTRVPRSQSHSPMEEEHVEMWVLPEVFRFLLAWWETPDGCSV